MHSDTLKSGSKLGKSNCARVTKTRPCDIKPAIHPAKIFYLWEKHGIKRIELFSME